MPKQNGSTMTEKKKPRRKITGKLVVQILAVFVVGSLIGVGSYTFIYAKGYSYLTDNPEACVNCHAMEPQFEGWKKGTHHTVATCNDCHAPHDNIVHKYYVKGENGLWHGFMFSTDLYPENIKIRDSNRKVTNDACLYCHADFTHDIRMTSDDEQMQCTRCHTDVGHESR